MRRVASISALALCLLCASLAALVPASARAMSIGLFSALNCSSCNLSLHANETAAIYVNVMTEGLPDGQVFTAAEFKVIDLPAGWSATAVADSEAILAQGDPFGPTGASITFTPTRPRTCIHLYTVMVTATNEVTEGFMQVTGRTPPTDPAFPCPRIDVTCGGGPCETYCVEARGMFINSTSTCGLALAERTWSEVRSLYR